GLLSWGLRGMGGTAKVDERYRARLPRIFAASCAMGVALWIAAILLKPALGTDYVRYIALLGLIGLGAATYLGVAQMLGALKLSEIKGAVRRR
ncbi:MAG: lipid II flippase MurJ, partial [Pseudomonadota bacterium]